MSKVNFWRGNQSDYDTLEGGFTQGILYFVTDTNKVFLDGKEVSNNDLLEVAKLGMLKDEVDSILIW